MNNSDKRQDEKRDRKKLINEIIGDSIRIDASSMCQLKCPVCPHGTGEMGIIGKGYLKFQDFKKFIDDYPNFKNIELSNWGEMFLNPELEEIIKYAYIKDVNLIAENGVNLNMVSEEVLECLVKYQFKNMTISIDGATNNTYMIYRKGGNFNVVIENIKRVNYYKRKYETEFPKLNWQFIIFDHNKHELPLARKMAKKLNMSFRPKFNWSSSYSPIKDKEFVRKKVGIASRQEYELLTGSLYFNVCNQLWTSPQINWDGKLLGCCANRWVDFGNVFEIGLKKCLKSKKYIYAKKMIQGKKKARKDIPCFYCPRYKRMQSTKKFFKHI